MSDEQKPRKPSRDKKAEKVAAAVKEEKPSVQEEVNDEEEHRASPRKRAVIFAVGLLMVVVGFLVLNQANAAADNWAGKISPLLLLGGYGVVFWAIWI